MGGINACINAPPQNVRLDRIFKMNTLFESARQNIGIKMPQEVVDMAKASDVESKTTHAVYQIVDNDQGHVFGEAPGQRAFLKNILMRISLEKHQINY